MNLTPIFTSSSNAKSMISSARWPARRGCQLLISTHSEIILEDTGPEQILSFYGKPHRLAIETDRDQVREALKRLSSLDILAAENGQHVLYVEDETTSRYSQSSLAFSIIPFSRFAASPLSRRSMDMMLARRRPISSA